MPSANVNWSLPLTRENALYPGQYGVPGAWTETGLRQHCTGAIFYVDPNNTDANDNRDGTDPTAPLATVATAITKCQAYRGDVIAVMANNAWGYNDATQGYGTAVQECVTVNTPGVRIVGVCPSGALGVPWTPATADGVCITVYQPDVLIEGFCFMGNGGGTGIYAEYSTRYGDNLTVRHCFFDDAMDEGVQLEYSWYADIHHNLFDECDSYGVYTANVGGNDPAYARVHHNWFYDIGTGGAIWLTDADRCHIYENYIYNNDAASGAAGTTANCMINLTAGSRNLVHHNTLSCVLPAGVAWDYDACNTAGTADSWNQNYLMDGVSVTNPT